MSASRGGHVEVVRYLCEVGGKELLMMTDEMVRTQEMDICKFFGGVVDHVLSFHRRGRKIFRR